MNEITGDINEVIRQRYSCRTYVPAPIRDGERSRLEAYMESLPPAPFENKMRFALVAARERDRRALRGLGTYGFIHGATGFIIGAIQVPEPGENAPHYLEDFGYNMEKIILQATALGLGTCWLGGTFTKSSFARAVKLQDGELIPCVSATGYPSDEPHLVERLIRSRARPERRRPWQQLFFDGDFDHPLERESSGNMATPLETVRIAPSASNRQPWRVLRDRGQWHFYLRRTPGYRENMLNRLVTVADLQRIDLGIAMCHFEMSAKHNGISGGWVYQDPGFEHPNEALQYTSTWRITQT